MKIILASASPRRKDILNQFNYQFDVISQDIDEVIDTDKTYIENVLKISKDKCSVVAKDYKDCLVIGCDTMVVYDNVIYGKPKSKEESINTLLKLSNKTHIVISGVCVMCNEIIEQFYDITYVTFKELSYNEVVEYVDTNEPIGKAGSYAIQGIGEKLIEKIEGSLYNVIGLPIEKLEKIIEKILKR
ncbi:MAG: Maf family protein [Anaeroplasmataceae bacterium]